MAEPKICCNCLHCARWRKKDGIECHCDLTDRYLGYLDVMDEENDCKHWEKETKWDLQKKHDTDLLDKVAEKLKAEVNICKNCMIVDCDTEYFRPMCEKADKGFIVAEVEEIVDVVIKELKAEVDE